MVKRPQKEYNMENKILLQFLSDAVQNEIYKFQIFFCQFCNLSGIGP